MQLKYSDLLIHNLSFSWCLIRNEGLLGFYKGVVPNLIRVTPACCITFVVYENVSRFLLDQHKWTENMNECSGAVLQGAELGLGWAVPSATVFDVNGGVIRVNREKSNILVLSGKLKCMMLQSSKCHWSRNRYSFGFAWTLVTWNWRWTWGTYYVTFFKWLLIIFKCRLFISVCFI